MEISEIDAIDSSAYAWPAEPTSRTQVIDDPIMVAAVSVAVIHQVERALGAAMDSEQAQLIDILIKYGHNPDGILALLYAIKVNDERAVQLLLDHGADPNAIAHKIQIGREINLPNPFFSDVPALSIAASTGNLNIIQMLMERGAKIRFNPADDNWNSCPLNLAVVSDQSEVVAHLISRGALGDLHDHDELRLLIYQSVKYGSANVLKWFKKTGIDFKKYDCNWLLGVAIDCNKPKALEFLLELGIVVNDQAFLSACGCCDGIECVELLMKYGANVNSVDDSGQSPLWRVLFSRNQNKFQVAKMLIDAGSDVNYKNEKYRGFSFVHYINHIVSGQNEMPYNDYTKCIECLLAHGANINATDQYGKTALFYAKPSQNKKWTEWLIAHGARD